MNQGFTLVEIMVVVVILALLAGIAYPALTKAIAKADEAKTMADLKTITNATISWAGDNNGRLPSPQYQADGADLPPYWDLATTSGLWLDGVVFAQVYIGNDDPEKEQKAYESFKSGGGSAQASEGGHLVGTAFENTASVKKLAGDRNWYHHSYAMNANLKPDEINAGNFLSEKSLTKFIGPNAMLFIDSQNTNVVMATDAGAIIETGKTRYQEPRVLASFLDGNVQKVAEADLPTDTTSREGSLFWLGVQP